MFAISNCSESYENADRTFFIAFSVHLLVTSFAMLRSAVRPAASTWIYPTVNLMTPSVCFYNQLTSNNKILNLIYKFTYL